MITYVNTTKNTQIFVSNGKRITIKSGDTISVDKEVDTKIYDFLKKVDDNKTVTQPSSVSTSPELEKRVADLEETVAVCLKRLEILKNAVQTISEQTEVK